MRDGSKCHEGSINQLVAGEDGELVTIGKSGFWFWFPVIGLVCTVFLLHLQSQVPMDGFACGT